jgi:hypothetical protein
MYDSPYIIRVIKSRTMTPMGTNGMHGGDERYIKGFG